MYLVLSKIVNVFLSPFLWVLVLYLLSFITKRSILRKRLKIAAIVLLLVFTNPLLFRSVMSGWENDPVPSHAVQNRADIVVVLGGMAAYHETSERIKFHGSVDRLLQAIALYRKSIVNKIVISGGNPNIIRKERPESEYLKEYLKLIGIPGKEIFIENKSKNTYQNAQFTAELFEDMHWDKRIILVTSAIHSKRARLCFEKVGFTVTSYDADPMKSVRAVTIKEVFVPDIGVMGAWKSLFREWIGLLAYKIKGYI